MKKLHVLFLLLLASLTASAATPPPGFLTGSGNSSFTNYLSAAVSSANIGLWPVAVIYNTNATMNNAVGLSWGQSPAATNGPTGFTNTTYRLYFGNLNTPGPTNTLFCATNTYAVFYGLSPTITYFFFATAKDEAAGVESVPSNLLIAKPTQ